MAATFVSYQQDTADAGTEVDVTDAGLTDAEEGDMMFAFAYGLSNSTHSWTPPSGWTSISSSDFNDSYLEAFYKRRTDSEPSDHTFTFGSTGDLAVLVLVYENDIDDSAYDDSNADSDTLVAPSLNTSVDDLTVMRIIYGDNADSVTITEDAGTTSRADAGTSYVAGKVSDEVIASAGASGTSTFVVTNGTLADTVTMSIAILDGVWSGAGGGGGASFALFID